MRGSTVAPAYDSISASYDDLLEGDRWMRSALWARYGRLFRPGDTVLDVGCGTGQDALFLASRGVRVVAIDVAPAMVARLAEEAATRRLERLVDARVTDLAEAGRLPAEGFDGVISAFAGLSTTPDLAPFARDAARLLRPGGGMMLHMLGRISLWEWLGALRHLDWSGARAAGRAERDFTIGGIPVRHFLYLPHGAYRRFFEPQFTLRAAFSLGCLRPPHTVRRVPAPVAEALGRLEPVLGRHRPFLNWGRFFVLEMARR